MVISKRTRVIVALLSLLILLSLIQESYAKYITNASANTNMSIARWNIKVNTQDIINNNDFSEKITPVFPGNAYIASDILAPMSEGYIDLIIDHAQVDVAFNEVITLSYAAENTIDDLIITGYLIDSGVVTNFTTNTIINYSVPKNPTTTSHKIRIYVKWLDGTGETMDNEADTQATVDGIASINVNVSFIQAVS